MRRNYRDQSEPCSSDRKIPKMVLLIAPSMAMAASSPSLDPWINIESTQGFLTPLGFEMTCFWMVHPQLSFRAKREIPMMLLFSAPSVKTNARPLCPGCPLLDVMLSGAERSIYVLWPKWVLLARNLSLRAERCNLHHLLIEIATSPYRAPRNDKRVKDPH